MNKRLLRFLTIIGPVGFILLVLFFIDFALFSKVEFTELVITFIVLVISATIFSWWVFSQIDQREAEINKRASQLEALNMAAVSLITELDLSVVLQKVVDLSRDLVSSRYGALGVLDDYGTSYQQFIVSGISEEARKEIGRPPIGLGLFRTFMEGKSGTLRVDDISSHEEAAGFPPNHPPMHTLIGVPIIAKDKIIGTLYLSDKMPPFTDGTDTPLPFNEEDERILELFATQAAIAIENARLYRQVQQLAVLEERQRFGMDLHDGVIQSIYAVGLMLEDIQRRVTTNPESAKEGISNSIRSLNTAISDIRNYILDLRPQHFQGRNIVQGVEELTRALRANTFIDVNLDIQGVDSRTINPENTVEILHIAQEAISNIQKHSRASEVDILMYCENGDLQLDIIDNGVSITAANLQRSRGNGLRNMQDRASGLNGEIVIGPRLEGGTEVRLRVPIRKQ